MRFIKYYSKIILLNKGGGPFQIESRKLFISILETLVFQNASYQEQNDLPIGQYFMYIESELYSIWVPSIEYNCIWFDGDLDKFADILAFVRNLLPENEKIVVYDESFEEHEIEHGITGNQIKKIFIPDYSSEDMNEIQKA